jgi:hypothetical protein
MRVCLCHYTTLGMCYRILGSDTIERAAHSIADLFKVRRGKPGDLFKLPG